MDDQAVVTTAAHTGCGCREHGCCQVTGWTQARALRYPLPSLLLPEQETSSPYAGCRNSAGFSLVVRFYPVPPFSTSCACAEQQVSPHSGQMPHHSDSMPSKQKPPFYPQQVAGGSSGNP
jgi:hypothetical protein